MTTLNKKGFAKAKRLIRSGRVYGAKWEFSAQDEDAILNGDNWDAYGEAHLGLDESQPDATKARYKYPFAKEAGGLRLFSEAIKAIRIRSSQQGDQEIFKAAGVLMDMLNGNDAAIPNLLESRGVGAKQLVESLGSVTKYEPLAKTYTQYKHYPGTNSFTAVGNIELQPTLDKFAYRVHSTPWGIEFEKMRPQTDELYTFENSVMTEVLGEIDKFWELKPTYDSMGLLFHRGQLLYGPPGTGKTSLLHQVAEMIVNRGDVVFYARHIGTLSDGLKAFREVEPDRKVVVCLEDADEYIGYQERLFLQLLDGEESVSGVLYLATTNYIERFPPRLLRPGRFDQKILVGPPAIEGRTAYLKAKLGKIENDEEIARLAKETDGFSFGDLRELILAVYALKEPAEKVLARLKGRKSHRPVESKRPALSTANEVKEFLSLPVAQQNKRLLEGGSRFPLVETVSVSGESLRSSINEAKKTTESMGRIVVSQADSVNRNRRIYPSSVWQGAISRANPRIEDGLIGGAVDHPGPIDGGVLKDSPIIWRSLEMDADGVVYGEPEVVAEHSRGKDVLALMAAGRAMPFSTRGFGTAHEPTSEEKEKYGLVEGQDDDVVIINPDYDVEHIDLVDTPSCVTAYKAGNKPSASESISRQDIVLDNPVEESLMDLNELKTKHPEAFKAHEDAVKAAADAARKTVADAIATQLSGAGVKVEREVTPTEVAQQIAAANEATGAAKKLADEANARVKTLEDEKAALQAKLDEQAKAIADAQRRAAVVAKQTEVLKGNRFAKQIEKYVTDGKLIDRPDFTAEKLDALVKSKTAEYEAVAGAVPAQAPNEDKWAIDDQVTPSDQPTPAAADLKKEFQLV